MISFTDRPLRLCAVSGFLILLFTFVLFIVCLTMYGTGNLKEPGPASLILSIWCACGFLMMTAGLLGCYIGKIFNQVKNRPIYLIDETINIEGCKKE